MLDEGDPFSKLNLDRSIANIKARNILNLLLKSKRWK